MTAPRLTAEFRVKALVRRVHDAGGSAAILARGDSIAGAVLVLTVDRGESPAFWERGPAFDGPAGLVRCGPGDSDGESPDAYWRRRRARDPDLWVVEVDVAGGERFAAETIADG